MNFKCVGHHLENQDALLPDGSTGLTRLQDSVGGVNVRSNEGIFKGKWWPETESNRRHGDFQSPALPTELSGQPRCQYVYAEKSPVKKILVDPR